MIPRREADLEDLTEAQASEIEAHVLDRLGPEHYAEIVDGRFGGLVPFLKQYVKWRDEATKAYLMEVQSEKKREKEVYKLGILVRQQLIDIMLKAGKTDEEIDEALAACDARGDNRGDTVSPGAEQGGTEDALSAA